MITKTISEIDWLDAMGDPENRFTMNTCRFDCFNTNWHIPRHVMKEHLICFLEYGYLGLKLDNREINVEPGMVIWVPPGGDRELWGRINNKGFCCYKMRFNLIDPSGRDLRFCDKNIYRQQAWDLFPCFQLLVEANLQKDQFQNRQLRNLISAFSAVFFRLLEQEPQQGHVFNNNQKRIIGKVMTRHMQCGLNSSVFAEELNLTRDYFARIFRNTFEMSPRRYIKVERMRYAASRLLESTISIKELAFELNYDNVNLFCRQFKDVWKVTPSQYRKN